MKKLLIFSLLAVSTIFAVEETTPVVVPVQDFAYASFGLYLPAPMPAISVGYRSMLSYGDSIDMSANIASIYIENAVEAQVKYLHYFKGRDYIGLGASVGFAWQPKAWGDEDCTYVAPIVVVGTEYEDKFIELNCQWPAFTNHGKYYTPNVFLKWGFKF